MKKKVIFLVVAVSLILTACSSGSVEIDIVSPIEFYAVFMSSQPGFPLNAEIDFKGMSPSDVTLEWQTDNGDLLDWGKDMKVRIVGKNFIEPPETVYWTPLDKDKGVAEKATVTLVVTLIDGGKKSTYSKSIVISINNDGMYELLP